MNNSEIVLQVGVKVLLKNPQGMFLLLRSNPEKYPEKGGRWDLPGGRIDAGTTLFENLQREVLEEASLNLTAEPTLIAAQDILKVPGRHVVRLTYVGSIEGEPHIDHESLEYRWFTQAEIQEFSETELDQFFRELVQTGKVF